MGTLISYFKSVVSEMKQVTWPKKAEVVRLTMVVIIFSVIVSAYLGSLDFLFTKLLELVIIR